MLTRFLLRLSIQTEKGIKEDYYIIIMSVILSDYSKITNIMKY